MSLDRSCQSFRSWSTLQWGYHKSFKNDTQCALNMWHVVLGNWPHGAESHLIRQVCVMWQQGREEVLGEGVHGNTLPVDDLTKTAERTSWTQGKTKTMLQLFFFATVSKTEELNQIHSLKLKISEKSVRLTERLLEHEVKKGPERMSSYLLVAVRPVSEESEPGGRPAPVLEVLRQSAPRYDTPGTYSQRTFYSLWSYDECSEK